MNQIERHGFLTYKKTRFFFIFNGKELQLIPPEGQEDKAENLTMDVSKNGVRYSGGGIKRVDESQLTGNLVGLNQKIIFLIDPNTPLKSYNFFTIYFPVIGFIEDANEEKPNFNSMTFYSPELNIIYPLKEMTEFQFSESEVSSVKVTCIKDSIHKCGTFNCDNVNIHVSYKISKTANLSSNSPYPLILNSALHFSFERTNDYNILIKIYYLAKRFIAFLCNRNDIIFSKIELSPCGENTNNILQSRFTMAEMLDDASSKTDKCINYHLLEGKETKILQDIADNKLLLRHIPQNEKASHIIDDAQIILLTSVFENEYEKYCEKNDTKSKNQIIKTYLVNKLSDAYPKFKDLFNLKINSINQMNELNLDDIFSTQEIKTVRNDVAHGHSKSSRDLPVLSGLILLKYLVLSMQLKSYGISDESVKKALEIIF